MTTRTHDGATASGSPRHADRGVGTSVRASVVAPDVDTENLSKDHYRCHKCHDIQYKAEFRVHKNRGRITTCRQCEAKRRKLYYQETKK